MTFSNHVYYVIDWFSLTKQLQNNSFTRKKQWNEGVKPIETIVGWIGKDGSVKVVKDACEEDQTDGEQDDDPVSKIRGKKGRVTLLVRPKTPKTR